MTFGSWTELFALLGSFVASAFALVRVSLAQHRAIVDRFVTFFEEAFRRQEAALDRLADNVRENSALLARMSERM